MYNQNILNEFIKLGYLDDGQAYTVIDSGLPAFLGVVKHGFCTQMQALEVMGRYYGLPTCDIEMQEIDVDLVNKFSKAVMLKNKFLPISLKNGVLNVASARPTDFLFNSSIKAVHQGEVKYYLAIEDKLISKINSLFATKGTLEVLRNLDNNPQKEEDQTKDENEIQNAPAVMLVDSLINEAISLKASDIHIEPFEKTVRVRYRIDGSLYNKAQFPIDAHPAVSARLKILAGINIAERRIPQDGRLNMTIGGKEYDFRISTLPTSHGEKFVIRILDKSAFSFTRKELGFTDGETAIVDKILSHPHGIVLLTGPTGCGKSTTLYSFLKELNKVDVNIVTVEDPVEYTLEGVNQTQVNIKANLTFANALRSILRQDPNIIMIGEIRDEETAQIAIRAAITGHLVFSTLHTNNAVGSITRLIDMGIPPYLVADAVVGVIAQRLIKKLCPKCKSEALTTSSETALLRLNEPVKIYHPIGCPHCNNTGYKGRTAVHEIMYLTDKIRNAITAKATLGELKALCKENGTVSLWESCRKLVLDGETSINELATFLNEN